MEGGMEVKVLKRYKNRVWISDESNKLDEVQSFDGSLNYGNRNGNCNGICYGNGNGSRFYEPRYIDSSEIYNEICRVLNPDQIRHWGMTLYFAKTPESMEIVRRYKYPRQVSYFNNDIDGTRWVEVAFAYPLKVGEI